MSKRPIILVSGNRVEIEGNPCHVVRHGYIEALVETINALPLIIPAMATASDLEALAPRIDGVLLTGSPRHVSPTCYGEDQKFEDQYLDIERDRMVLPLITKALMLNIPTLAICRGYQELNVAMGGTLHQYVHEVKGMRDHRARKDLPMLERYTYQSHRVKSQNGGWFEKLGIAGDFTVNSLHEQGINKLGKGLHVEAISEDGLVEAVSVPDKKFFLATQWHPEASYSFSVPDQKIFGAFGEAVKKATP